MKLVIQRVDKAQVRVNRKVVGSIGKGLLVLVGFSKSFEDKKIELAAQKILNLRFWESDIKGFDLSVQDIKGEIMIVSQFTLFGKVSGNKPDFSSAMNYDCAKKNYEKFLQVLKKKTNLNIQTGEFGAMMNIELINNGPVTIILDL